MVFNVWDGIFQVSIFKCCKYSLLALIHEIAFIEIIVKILLNAFFRYRFNQETPKGIDSFLKNNNLEYIPVINSMSKTKIKL